MFVVRPDGGAGQRRAAQVFVRRAQNPRVRFPGEHNTSTRTMASKPYKEFFRAKEWDITFPSLVNSAMPTKFKCVDLYQDTEDELLKSNSIWLRRRYVPDDKQDIWKVQWPVDPAVRSGPYGEMAGTESAALHKLRELLPERFNKVTDLYKECFKLIVAYRMIRYTFAFSYGSVRLEFVKDHCHGIYAVGVLDVQSEGRRYELDDTKDMLEGLCIEGHARSRLMDCMWTSNRSVYDYHLVNGTFPSLPYVWGRYNLWELPIPDLEEDLESLLVPISTYLP